MLQIKPTQQFERIGSLDFLRGIAVLGILIINIESFAYGEPWSPYKFGINSSIDEWTRFYVYLFAQGKFFSMFTLLFGVGFYVFLERLEQKNIGLKAFDIYARRLLLLFIIGVFHAYLIWDGDVLYHYATCGFLLFPFRSFNITQLLLILLIPITILLYNSYERSAITKKKYVEFIEAKSTLKSERSNSQNESINYWENKTTRKFADNSDFEIPRKTISESIKANTEHTKVHKGVILYEGILFRTLIMMILGIILYKSGIFRNYHSIRYYWPLTIILILVSVSINYFRYYHWTFEYFDPVKSVWKSWLFTFPKETLGIAYILLFNGIYQKYLKNFKFKLLSVTGKMALTNYLTQSVICSFIFYGYGLSKYNQYSRFELLSIVVLIWGIQLIFGWIWFKKYSQGPVEWLWRKLTYNSFN